MLIPCKTCGKELNRTPCRMNVKAHYCNKKCRAVAERGSGHPNWKPKAKLKCENCGGLFEAKYACLEKQRRFCSTRCMGEWRSGSNNHNWNGGTTTEAERERKSREYKEWREAVFARDNWTCQDCGQRGGTLHAHHIFPFADFPAYRLGVWNGRTLCRKCHARLHPILRDDPVVKI